MDLANWVPLMKLRKRGEDSSSHIHKNKFQLEEISKYENQNFKFTEKIPFLPQVREEFQKQ